jgi:hypothetical protein
MIELKFIINLPSRARCKNAKKKQYSTSTVSESFIFFPKKRMVIAQGQSFVEYLRVSMLMIDHPAA